MSKLVVVYHTGSGRAEELDRVRSFLDQRDAIWIELDCVEQLIAQLQPMERQCETVIAAGGDGTVNATVNALMSLEPPFRPSLGIIPLGTANDFAGTLMISDTLAEAIGLLARDPIGVDVVKMSGDGFQRYYANMAAGGNCVRVSEAMTDEIKQRWGAFSYMRGAVDILPDMTSFRVNAQCDDELFADLNTWAVLVANGRTNAGRIEVAPLASPTDGLLDVIMIRDGSVGDMLEIVANNLLGSFLESEQVIFRQARSLRLASTPAMRFTIDGEVVDQEPVKFEVIPSAIAMHTGLEVR